MNVLFLKTKIRSEPYYQSRCQLPSSFLVDGNARFIILICAAPLLIFCSFLKLNKYQ